MLAELPASHRVMRAELQASYFVVERRKTIRTYKSVMLAELQASHRVMLAELQASYFVVERRKTI